MATTTIHATTTAITTRATPTHAPTRATTPTTIGAITTIGGIPTTIPAAIGETTTIVHATNNNIANHHNTLDHTHIRTDRIIAGFTHSLAMSHVIVILVATISVNTRMLI